jgi:glyoxylase-like metal-dependent hydrolase (beta-lactamase superfamily II)
VLKLHAIEGNRQWLDGGAMFGSVPRTLWSRWAEPDEQGRVELACRALLIDEGERKILLETGIGAFFGPELRRRYGVVEERHVLLDSLAALDLSDEDIDVVVLSHLHFDHAGGLLAAWQNGAPERLLFPRARFVVGSTALERARQPHVRDRASFITGLVDLLEASERLDVVEHGTTSLEWLGPRYSLSESQGHTPGLLHVTLRGAREQIFFCSDLVPGTAWVHLPVTMGYDRYPELLIDEKAALYSDLGERAGWLFFTHDPRVAAARLARDARGRYQAVEAKAAFGKGWELE